MLLNHISITHMFSASLWFGIDLTWISKLAIHTAHFWFLTKLYKWMFSEGLCDESNECQVKEMSVRERFPLRVNETQIMTPDWINQGVMGSSIAKRTIWQSKQSENLTLHFFTVFIILFYDSQDKSKLQDVQNNLFLNTGILLNWLILFWYCWYIHSHTPFSIVPLILIHQTSLLRKQIVMGFFPSFMTRHGPVDLMAWSN